MEYAANGNEGGEGDEEKDWVMSSYPLTKWKYSLLEILFYGH
jgi:hypothetical protein